MPENNLPQQPQYIYIQPQPEGKEDDEVEIDLWELFGVVWKRKWLIFFLMILGTALGLGYALYLPFIYKAEAKIMPQSGGTGGRMSGLVAQYGSVASMMGIALPEGTGNTSAVFIEILQSKAIVDKIIDKFNLMGQYEAEYRLHARKAVLKNLDLNTDATGSGIITISYLDEDPQKAADIVNAFIDELQRKTQEMSITFESQNRTTAFTFYAPK